MIDKHNTRGNVNSKNKTTSTTIKCFVQPDVLNFSKQQIKNELTINNPYPFDISFEIRSSSPLDYSVQTAKGQIESRTSIKVAIRIKSKQVLEQQDLIEKGELTHHFQIRVVATVDDKTLESKKVIQSVITHVDSSADLFMNSSMMSSTSSNDSIASTGSISNDSAPIITATTRTDSSSRTSISDQTIPQQQLQTEVNDREEEESVDDEDDKWKGIMHYLPMIIGVVLVLLLSWSEDVTLTPTKSLFAAFFIGMAVMYIQAKLSEEDRRERRSLRNAKLE